MGANPVLPCPFDPKRFSVLGLVGYDDDFRSVIDAPAAAEDVDDDFAEAAYEGDVASPVCPGIPRSLM
jgi:hypothetical protein